MEFDLEGFGVGDGIEWEIGGFWGEVNWLGKYWFWMLCIEMLRRLGVGGLCLIGDCLWFNLVLRGVVVFLFFLLIILFLFIELEVEDDDEEMINGGMWVWEEGLLVGEM